MPKSTFAGGSSSALNRVSAAVEDQRKTPVVNELLEEFAFASDPFESTNAENEPQLSDYFVPPPYFATVMGDPGDPKSHIVFAPRGSGKTAQRRMIEDECVRRGDVMCITYDSFDQPTGFAIANVDLAYHLSQLCRQLLLAVLLGLDLAPEKADELTEHQRQLLKYQIDEFLGPLSVQEFETGVKAIKSLGDLAADLWKKYGGPIAAAIQVLLKKAGLDGVEIPATLVAEARQDESLRYHLEHLLRIVEVLGYRSTYILIDKVDEIPSTSADAEATFLLISPLLTDLPTLEAEGVGFKFFLWDQIADDYRKKGGRPDRVPILELRWSTNELSAMLDQRLTAFSGGKVQSFDELCDPDIGLDVHKLVCHLAYGSPRDMIRLCKSIVDEHTRAGPTESKVESSAVYAGIQRFADQRTAELFPEYIDDVRRVGQPTFTINYVASEVFHISAQAARAKIQSWLPTGVVQQVGEVPNPGSRPMNLYGVVDPRVAISMLPAVDIPLVLGNYFIECPDCSAILVSAENSNRCQHCGREFDLAKARSLLEVCSTE